CGLQRARGIIDGHDLTKIGLSPGPRLGQILNHVHDRILAGHIVTRQEALAFAQSLIDEEALPPDENYGQY
ncbi:hypothetical protein KAR02_06270, partial [Candidatus Bipolaricaulota bacterium]|nr:hypothetical protein [Candidatus Bipolaricaulota bacterium]